MTYFAPRTVTEAHSTEPDSTRQPIQLFRDRAAYVLLGDPGAGKTEIFKQEAEAVGGVYRTVRDFLALPPRSEWRTQVLFIDALDESRAGQADGRNPLDAIRCRLDELGRPSFRLSCREADWLGASDQGALTQVSPDGKLAILHLDPLTEVNVKEILEHDGRVGNAAKFMEDARNRGLGGLLDNPQSLRLLVEAVSGDQWPATREDTYELACRRLVSEHSREHLAARHESPLDADKLLSASGYLCAIQLLADLTGFALNTSFADKSHTDLMALRSSATLPLQHAIKTKIFRGDGEGRFVPIHRSIAEYLAAVHIGSLVEQRGLPVGRVLALMVGKDGGVVTALRGLYAWLAVHCHTNRFALIERDPLGIVLYGDVRNFSFGDKREILRCLGNEAKQYAGFRSQDWSSPPFGAFGTADMEPNFREVMGSPARDDAHQAVTSCVIDALCHGEPMHTMADLLMEIVCDASRWSMARQRALDAFIRIAPTAMSQVRELADDIIAGRIADENDEILGRILKYLYPSVIPASRILDYLRTRKRRQPIEFYSHFWRRDLPERTSSAELPTLLDRLADRAQTLLPEFDEEYHVKKMIGALLERGLRIHGEAASDEQLYRWLGIGLDRLQYAHLGANEVTRIAEWIAVHPDQYKAVIAVGAAHCAEANEPRICMFRVEDRLYRVAPPADIGLWYLRQARIATNDRIGQYFVQMAVATLCREHGHEGLSLNILESFVGDNPRYEETFQRLLVCDLSDWQREHAQAIRESRQRHKAIRVSWVQIVRNNIASIRDGTALGALQQLAHAYFNHFSDVSGDSPTDRLRNLLDNNNDLVQIVLEGFQRVLVRPDLPSVAQILDTYLNDKVHAVCWPCLAGIDEFCKAQAESVLTLAGATLSRILAFKIAYEYDEEREWMRVLVREEPDLVASALVEYASRMFSAKKDHVVGLYQLAYDDNYEVVARRSVPQLLDAFPTNATSQQVSSLKYLLRAATCRLGHPAVSVIVENKLQLELDALQRGYWLACGFVVKPETYASLLRAHHQRHADQSSNLTAFFGGYGHEAHGPVESLPPPSLGLLIELLGEFGRSDWPEGPHAVTSDMEAGRLVEGMISALGGMPTEAARDELERLMTRPELAKWKKNVRRAQYAQRTLLREKHFLFPGAGEVVATLANREPSSVADLAALALDHIRELALEIAHRNTDIYKQFWNEDRYGRPTRPKTENSCRDSLLGQLRTRLTPLNIDAQPEGSYAKGGRADIRVSFGAADGFNVPIEIKRNVHEDVWSAIRDQLIKKYAPDPGAAGYGIYLVLWFGNNGTPVSPDNVRPKSAQELATLLANSLSTDERRRISVCVIDCTPPARAGSSHSRQKRKRK